MLNSIILNIHREKEILLLTLKSLGRAVSFAKDSQFELVAVLDRTDTMTRSLVEQYDFSVFHSVKIIEVDFGSLGLSRSAGIQKASGDFIFIADADDLISYNFFDSVISERNKTIDKNIIYFPELFVHFGDIDAIVRFYGEPELSPLLFFKSHPLGSRIASYKDNLINISWMDLPVGKGYAYEDWHMNLELLAAGNHFKIAPGTILFYRRDASPERSLLSGAAAKSLKIPPASNYFRPDIYVKLGHKDYLKYRFNKPTTFFDSKSPKDRALELRAFFDDAHEIEPFIHIDQALSGPSGTNLADFQLDSALVYYELCSIVKGMQFDHIVLMPFITKGGAEKYLLNILEELANQNPNSRILVLTGLPYGGQIWDEKLPINAVYIDLPILSGSNNWEDYQLLTLRLLEATAKENCNIHVIPCPYSENFLRLYGSVLNHQRFIFYYFCSDFHLSHGKMRRVEGSDFIERNKALCSLVISDNVTEFNLRSNKAKPWDRFPIERFKCIYTLTDIVREADSTEIASTPNLFWASRIDEQKRPSLIPLIGKKISQIFPENLLKVYGYSALNIRLTQQVQDLDYVEYCGGFNGISSIPTNIADILIYTSFIDGLPNVILEAIAVGMVVIAVDVGGIHEIIKNDETGILLPSLDSDEDMAQAYVTAIVNLVNNPDKRLKLVKNAQALLKQEHSYAQFSQNIADAFPRP